MKKVILGIVIGLQLFVLAILLLKPKLNFLSKTENLSLELDTAKVPSSIAYSDVNPVYVSNYIRKEIVGLPSIYSSFIPAGYSCIDTASGDLNKDELKDVILVLKLNNEESFSNGPKRTLLVLAGTEDNSFQLKGRNDDVVMRMENNGHVDPFKKLVIKNGYFSIENSRGESDDWLETIVTFNFSEEKHNWLLHRVGQIRHKKIHGSIKDYSELQTQKDFGEVLFEDYNIYKEVFNPEQ